jgi:hypothetical protein
MPPAVRAQATDWLIAILVGLLSIGWIVPLYLAASAYLSGFELLLRTTEVANSFPYFDFGRDTLWMGSTWCLVSAVCWSTFGAYRLLVAYKSRQDG